MSTITASGSHAATDSTSDAVAAIDPSIAVALGFDLFFVQYYAEFAALQRTQETINQVFGYLSQFKTGTCSMYVAQLRHIASCTAHALLTETKQFEREIALIDQEVDDLIWGQGWLKVLFGLVKGGFKIIFMAGMLTYAFILLRNCGVELDAKTGSPDVTMAAIAMAVGGIIFGSAVELFSHQKRSKRVKELQRAKTADAKGARVSRVHNILQLAETQAFAARRAITSKPLPTRPRVAQFAMMMHLVGVTEPEEIKKKGWFATALEEAAEI